VIQVHDGDDIDDDRDHNFLASPTFFFPCVHKLRRGHAVA
jgi:hypothetical protein